MIATSYSEDSSSLFRSRLLYSRQHRLPILLLFLATVALTMAKWAVVDGIAFTHEDSGEYLVLGQRILAGDRLYVDIWGNKPPLIFYINAVGIKLSGGSPVGVLALCYVAIGAAYYT